MACGAQGLGRLAPVDWILECIHQVLTPPSLLGKRVLVTAGPTWEAIDPVRHLTNASSGKMGYALAKVAQRRGAAVTLVTGPTALVPPRGVKVVRIRSARQMHHAVMEAFSGVDAVVMAAAVSDYRPKVRASQKIKKTGDGEILELERSEDILLQLAEQKRSQILVGFAAETENVAENAREKLRKKNLDFIIANDVTAADSGFASDTNQVTILWPDGKVEALPLQDKEMVAGHIWDRLEYLWQQ